MTRYVKEMDRVISVLEQILTGKDYLVANKYSYADLAFTVWWPAVDILATEAPEIENWREKYPNVARWDKAIRDRPAVAAAFKTKQSFITPAKE